jgi:hypothetical protein
MQDIIQKIIEIDRVAQKMTDEARALKQEAQASIESDKKALRDKYILRARDRIKVTADTEEKFLDETLADIEKKYSLIGERLNGEYEKNREKWVDELYNRIIGG